MRTEVGVTVDDDEVSMLVPVVQFDALPMSAAGELLTSCCTSSRWAHQVLLGRPYHSLRVLSAASDDVLADLAWSDIAEALAGHPRIGERVEGAGREAGWSRGEQAGAQQAGEAVAAELRAGNLAYEQRFGHVFLICATGRSAEQILAALQQRLGNPTAIERDVVRAELQAIVRLRLIKTFR